MENNKIGYWSVVAIGIGGMIGGGIFAVLGLAVELAHGSTPIAFLLAGLIALITAYSYAKLSVCYPSEGGTVVFLDRAFGNDLFTGTMNTLLWVSYIVMLALYAYAFGNYGITFFHTSHPILIKHLLISAGILIPCLLNILNAQAVGKTEIYIVILKLLILALFIVIGFHGINYGHLAVTSWPPPLSIVAGGMIIFIAYEGFELIANTAKDVKNYQKTLPIAYYSAVGFVIIIYILVAMVTVGNLPVDQIIASKDYALAQAALPFLGKFGFTLMAAAAVLSTFSAINATLYGSARLSYCISKEGELPRFMQKKVWNKPLEGLFITTALALILANSADLASIATMGSTGFLLIFAMVNAANFVKHKETNSSRWITGLGAVACLTAITILIWRTYQKLYVIIFILLISFLAEALYRLYRQQKFKL